MLDLFCGAGGISHGFEQAGFRVVGGVDFDPSSVETFQANHEGAKGIRADLSDLSPKDLADASGLRTESLDCVAGGPPCQGFSRNRAFRHQDGVFVDDPRNHLYWHFFEFVEYFRPKFVVMENVPEILMKADGYFRDAVFKKFTDLGYSAEARVINAAEFGAPQSRRRAFFVAGRDGQRVRFPYATTLPGRRAGRRTPTSRDYIEPALKADDNLSLFDDALPVGPTVWEAISDLHGAYAESLDGKCSYASEPSTDYQRDRREGADSVCNHFRWRLTERQLKRVRLVGQGQGLFHLPESLRTKNGYGSAYRRMQSDAQALTITTWMFHPGSGMFTHPFEDRVVTIREAARLQSFQDWFVFKGKYHSQCRQVGNSVAPLVARAIAESLLEILGHASVSARAIPARVKNSIVSSSPARLQSM